ncbi:MAG: hypothetical protein IPK35_09865 [Saprospiraceae bacterium]|nr:hypothetical protein [Saprospiraceae bacterium]
MSRILSFIFFIFIGLVAEAQCPNGNITLTTQAQIDNFAATYPGCSNTEYGITIVDDNDRMGNITNLNGLSGLNSIGGFFQIAQNDNLTSTHGLGNITSVGSYFTIIDNPSLVNLDGLSGVSSITGFLHIENNDALTNVDGLSKVYGIGNLSGIGNTSYNSIIIRRNDLLENISGLKNVLTDFITSITITNNPQLAWCDLPNICSYLSNPAKPSSISDNAPGCQSRPQIITECVSPCPTSDFTLSTQAQVNSFPKDTKVAKICHSTSPSMSLYLAI